MSIDEIVEGMSAQPADWELEDALVAEGIYEYGPDASRFERMFARVMHLRVAAVRARLEEQSND